MPHIEARGIVSKDGARTTGGKPIPTTKRHPDFYFDESLVIIKVQDTLFKVHKYHLLQSEIFSDMFKMPKGSCEVEEGSSPDHPIVLNSVSSFEFEALLKTLYARHFSNVHPSPNPSLIAPALRLAHMWNFTDLRSHLLPLAEKVLGAVDKIILSGELGIKEWLVPAYMVLCQRPEPLNIEEAIKLGTHSLLMISHMREQFHPLKPQTGSKPRYYCLECTTPDKLYSFGPSGLPCASCNSTRATYLAKNDGVGISGHNNARIEAQVKKWVEAGCVFKK